MARPVLTPLDGDGIIDTDELVDLAVTAAKLAADAVETAKILNAAVTTAKLATDAVTTVKILDAAVTNAKIANATGGSVGNVEYRRLGNMIHVWTNGDSSTETLPSGFRPAANVVFAGYDTATDNADRVQIDSSGNITFLTGSQAQFAVSFEVA